MVDESVGVAPYTAFQWWCAVVSLAPSIKKISTPSPMRRLHGAWLPPGPFSDCPILVPPLYKPAFDSI